MYRDELEAMLATLDIDQDDIVMGFEDRYGSYRLGRLEEDPEMHEYEDMLDLGNTLRAYC